MIWTTTPTISPRVTAHLDLKNAIHVGHSTGGGEVVRYLARHGESRVAKAAHHQRGAAAHAENAVQSRRTAQGVFRRTCRRSSPPIARSSIATSPPGPFYSYNRTGKPSEAVIKIGGAKA